MSSLTLFTHWEGMLQIDCVKFRVYDDRVPHKQEYLLVEDVASALQIDKKKTFTKGKKFISFSLALI